MTSTTFLVLNVIGDAWIREPDGSLVLIRPGMHIPAGADIVTADGASVELQADGFPAFIIAENRDVQLGADLVAQDAVSNENAVEPLDEDVATVLAALDAGEDPFDALDPTAAVVDGGGGHAGGSSFVRLLHVIEATEPLELAYRLSDDPALGLGSDGAAVSVTEIRAPWAWGPAAHQPRREQPRLPVSTKVASSPTQPWCAVQPLSTCRHRQRCSKVSPSPLWPPSQTPLRFHPW